MDRGNHYEAAFEAYLQWHRLCYIAVDETRRSMLGDSKVKSLDFLVHTPEARLLIDVKGRRFPSGKAEKPRKVWRSWCEREDVEGLERWEAVFGADYQGVLVFIYHLAPMVALPEDTVDLWSWRNRRYLVRAIPIGDYKAHMKRLSPSWDTFDLPMADFRRLVRPFRDMLYASRTFSEDTAPF